MVYYQYTQFLLYCLIQPSPICNNYAVSPPKNYTADRLLNCTASPPKPDHLLSALIHSFTSYQCDPPPETYHFVIKTLTKTSQFHHIPLVLDRIESVEKFETLKYILAELIIIYCRADRIEDAIDLFCRIPNFKCVPSVYPLNSLLSVLCRSKRKYRICSLILSSLYEQKDLALANFEVLGFFKAMKKLGISPRMMDYSNVIRFLVKEGRGLDALDVLCRMKMEGTKPDIVCYTLILHGIIAEGEYEGADELFDELLLLGLVPDVYTYNVYVNGLCKQNNVEAGLNMIISMEELGCKPNLITHKMLLKALNKNCGVANGTQRIGD
ncbi:hypothetical protein FEM48_Zijuj12G0159400 [Ziziphus jujuba var. spinosa]|uniref:Uncharacterized protein n=1 Tax=Ziziphus jujuba var. spinosa TaxID=714518 RepID=A0A978UE95_ZIZJJ|nr:hypothetical protein FEM48_Zijuj12G0159400 [Ziziphus jujuba var. spinosa]